MRRPSIYPLARQAPARGSQGCPPLYNGRHVQLELVVSLHFTEVHKKAISYGVQQVDGGAQQGDGDVQQSGGGEQQGDCDVQQGDGGVQQGDGGG